METLKDLHLIIWEYYPELLVFILTDNEKMLKLENLMINENEEDFSDESLNLHKKLDNLIEKYIYQESDIEIFKEGEENYALAHNVSKINLLLKKEGKKITSVISTGIIV